jgi:hypothetical protein
MAILMAVAYWVAQIVGDMYDRYNSYGVLTVVGLGVLAISVLSFAEGLWERWRHSRQNRD